MPHGATTPRPVTTTRRPSRACPSVLRACDDEVVGLADGLDALELLLVDGDVELLFERHDQLDEVEAVGVEVVARSGPRS